MPNPLSVVNPNANIVLGCAGDRPLARHPELAVLALEAIASWANVEGFTLNLFIELLGGNNSIAASAFLALEAQSAKIAAIKAAASTALRDKKAQFALLTAIMSIIKTNEKDRNKLAHWQWGDTQNIPDAVLLVNPKALLDGLKDFSAIYVYKAPDFLSIIQANERLCGYLLRFNFILGGHPANVNGQLFDELSNEPAIRERLDRQALQDLSNKGEHRR